MTLVIKPLQGFIFILAILFQDVRLVSFLWQRSSLREETVPGCSWGWLNTKTTLCLSEFETWHKPCCKHQLPHWRNLLKYSFIFCVCFVCIFRQVKCRERRGISAPSALAKNSKNGHFLKVQYSPALGFSSSPRVLLRTLTTHQVSGNQITNISCSRACVYSVLPTGHFPPHVTFSYHPESQDPDTSQSFQALVWFRHFKKC